MKKHRQKEKRKIPMLAALLFITLLALLLSTAGVTLAKYVTQRESANMAMAKPFYFSSNLLAEEAADTTVPYYQLDDTGSENVTISFTLSNFIDELRRTDKNISYSYEVLDSTGAKIAELAVEDPISGSAANTVEEKIELAASHLADGGVVTVRVTSTSPYSTTLSAKFGFVEDDSAGIDYSLSEKGSAVILTVHGGSGTESVTVNFPSGLVPDPSNDNFSTAGDSSLTFTPAANTSYALVFLKTDPTRGYSPADFGLS